jgi:hypothetical protein
MERSFDMSKRARSSKARSAPKMRSKAGTRKSAAPHHGARPNSKQARVVELLRRLNGATIATIVEFTGWQPHSVRGFFAGVVRKKLGLKLASVTSDGGRVYRIAGGGKPGVIDGAGDSRPQSRPRSIVSVRFGSMRCGGSGGWCSAACRRLV